MAMSGSLLEHPSARMVMREKCTVKGFWETLQTFAFLNYYLYQSLRRHANIRVWHCAATARALPQADLTPYRR